MKKFLLALLVCISALSTVYASPRGYFFYRVYTSGWYREPTFWILIGFLGLCVLIYNIVKDKD